jgi:non-heme Fe2+,alpha-ketoglutarate-dependent halogenase
MTGVITPEQAEFFKREGYLSPVRAISAEEAADYRSRIEEYEKTSGEEVNKRLKIKAHLAFPWLVQLARHPRGSSRRCNP